MKHASTTGRIVCLLVALGLTALAGCSGSDSDDDPGSSGGEGGTLTISRDEDIVATDNLQVRASQDILVMGSTVYEPLFTTGEDGTATPNLGVEATPSEDFKTWTVTVQSGVKFQNGSDFTAEDVVQNFDAILDPENASSLAGDFAGIESIEATDDTTVTFTLNSANNGFIGLLTDIPLMGDMDARAEVGAEEWAQHPIGTGPYKWESRTVGDNLTVVRNDDYWRGTPPLDEVIWRIIPDPQVATLALQSGDIDMMTNAVSTESLPSLMSDDSIQVLTGPTNTFYLAFLNEEKERQGGYKDGLAFRQGLAYLFNAQEIVPEVIGDFGEYANQPIPPWQDGNNPDIEAWPYDPDKGVELLTKGGYPPGSTIDIAVNVATGLCETATAVQSTLTELGYKVDLLCDGGTLISDKLLSYEWDVFMSRNNGSINASTYWGKRWRISLAEAKDDYYTLINQDLEDIVVAMPQQKTLEETNELAMEAADMVTNQLTAYIPLYWSNAFIIANKNVEGLVLSPIGWQSLLYNDYTTVRLTS